MIFLKCLKTCFQNGIYQLIKIGMKILLDKGIQGKEAKKVLPTLPQNTAQRDNRQCFCMHRKIPEPWAAWVCGSNSDKEVFAS